MFRPNDFRTSSIAALVLAAGLGATAAHAQGEDRTVDEVVVTGSFIAGTPEDAAIPVEVLSLDELRKQGSPSNLDLVKSLSEVGSVAGEANRASLFAVGAQTVNLRGVSSSRTVVLFNGRRLPEQYSASVGRFNNIALIPSAAIGRVELLKDGGATTYGADAVGGVVNYITRKTLDGVELNANWRWIEDSDGDWDADASFGKIGDNWNALAIVGYQKRNELDALDRDWTTWHYLENPSGWSATGSPSAYVFQRQPAPGVFSTFSPLATTASGNRYVGNRQMGLTGLVRDPNCSALGGYAGWSATPSPICYIPTVHQANLVEEQETWQAYGEVNYEFSDALKLHLEGLYYDLDIPHIPIDAFGSTASNFPALQPSLAGAPWPTQTVGVSSAFVVPGYNPAVRALLDALTNANGTPAFGNPTTPGTPAFQILNGGRVGLNALVWRPFGVGGNPGGQELDYQHNFSTTWRITAELSGALPEFAGFNLRWSAAVTHNQLDYTIRANDMLVDRLQAALNGLGGAGCTGTTPGANGCQFFNPFSSAIPANAYTGQTNPGFVPGLANDPALIQWMYVPIELVRDGRYTIADAILTGETPFRLWAEEPIAFAVGAQYRYFRESAELDPLSDRLVNPCATVGLQSCNNRTGPLVMSRAANLFGITQSSEREYPVQATFFEIQAPILDNLLFNVSGRYEKFFSDVSDRDNSVFVPAASLRWQVNDWFALRGTISESFSQVNPPEDVPPLQTTTTAAPTEFGGTAVTFATSNYPNLDVEPETGYNYNVGAIVRIGAFRANLDYYNITIDDLIRAQTTAQVVNALVQDGQTGATALINCSSPLVTEGLELLGGNPFVQLNGPCVQGVSALNSPAGGGGLLGGRVNYFGAHGTQTALVNGQTLKTSGIDFSAGYRFDDVWGGVLSVSVDATHILTYETSDYIVAGIPVAEGFDGVGQMNESTGRNSQHIAQDRGSITFNYAKGRHNLNWTTRMVGSLITDDSGDFLRTATYTANIGPTVPAGAGCVNNFGASPPVPTGAGTGEFGANVITAVGFCSGQNLAVLSGQKLDPTFTTDVTYQLALPWDTTLSVSVSNLFDEDPQFARAFLGYDAFVASPLGRTVKFGIRKIF